MPGCQFWCRVWWVLEVARWLQSLSSVYLDNFAGPYRRLDSSGLVPQIGVRQDQLWSRGCEWHSADQYSNLCALSGQCEHPFANSGDRWRIPTESTRASSQSAFTGLHLSTICPSFGWRTAYRAFWFFALLSFDVILRTSFICEMLTLQNSILKSSLLSLEFVAQL